MSKTPAKGQAKAPTPVPAKPSFDPKTYVKNGVSVEEVVIIKIAFDLFDSDQGGSVDIKGTPTFI